MLNLANNEDSSDDSSADSNSSSSSEDGDPIQATTTATKPTSTTAAQDNDNLNNDVNAYLPLSILHNPTNKKIPIKDAVKNCQQKSIPKRVTFTSQPSTYIPYPFLVTKHITTNV